MTGAVGLAFLAATRGAFNVFYARARRENPSIQWRQFVYEAQRSDDGREALGGRGRRLRKDPMQGESREHRMCTDDDDVEGSGIRDL